MTANVGIPISYVPHSALAIPAPAPHSSSALQSQLDPFLEPCSSRLPHGGITPRSASAMFVTSIGSGIVGGGQQGLSAPSQHFQSTPATSITSTPNVSAMAVDDSDGGSSISTSATSLVRRPTVSKIDTDHLPTETPSRNSLFFSSTITPQPVRSPSRHVRNASGSSQTFGASGSSLSLASLDSVGGSSFINDDSSSSSFTSSGVARWTTTLSSEQSLGTPTCQLNSASSIRSRRNWDEFEGKPVSPLPSPGVAMEDGSTTSMFDRLLTTGGGGSSGSVNGSSTGRAGPQDQHQQGHNQITRNGGSSSSEPYTPSKTSAFFGASWAAYPRAPSTLLPPPPHRRDRIANSSDAVIEADTSGGGWSTLTASSRAVSADQLGRAEEPAATPASASATPLASEVLPGRSDYGERSDRSNGPGYTLVDPGPVPGTMASLSSTAAASAAFSSAASATGPARYDGLPSFAYTSVRDRFEEPRIEQRPLGTESTRSAQRTWRDLDDNSSASGSSDGRVSSIGALADELSPLTPPASRRNGRFTRHAHGPSENASGSSLVPVVDDDCDNAATRATSTPAKSPQPRPTRMAAATAANARDHRYTEDVAIEDEDGDIIGPYRREAVLGFGAFSQVALGRAVRPTSTSTSQSKSGGGGTTPPDDDVVALKMLDREPCSQNERLNVSWVREVEVLKHISHPNLVRFVTAFSTPLHHTLVLEHVAGGELFELLAQHHDAMAQREWLVRRIFAELANAVGWMHHVNLVHRDVKLENILLTTSFFQVDEGPLTPSRLPKGPLVKLTDFGLSRFINPQEPSLETRCGSEEYAAPELIIGKRYDGRKTDAWALGVVLYAMLTGSLPFLDDDAGGGFSAARESHNVERDAKQRKAHLLRIAKGDLRWPEQSNDPAADRPSGDVCPGNLRLVTPEAKVMTARLLRRDATKRAGVWEAWDAEWLTKGSFGVGGEWSAAGERVDVVPDPRGEAGRRWLAERARVRGGQVNQVACDD